MLKNIISKFKKGDGLTAKASRQVVYSAISQGTSIIISLLYVPLLLKYLTQERYGIWLTLTSIIGWFSFFDIGMGNGMRNKLAEANAKGEKELGRKYVSTTYALLICIFASILVVFHIINPFINWNIVLNSKSISFTELYILTSVVFTFFILRFIVQLIGVIYMADLKPSVNNAVNAISSLFSLLFVLLLTKFSTQGDLVLLGSVITIMPVLLFVLLSIYAFNTKYAYLSPSFKHIDLKLNKGLMSLGAKFFLLQVTSVVLYSTSSFFIAQFYGNKEVVVYNLVFKYFQMPIMAYTILLTPLWSSVTNAYTNKDFVWLKTTMKRLNLISLVVIAGIIMMIFFSDFVFKLWLGKQQAADVKIPFILTLLMALYSIMNVFIAPYSYFVNGTGKLKLTMLFSVIGIALYFISIYLFGHKFTNSSGVLIAILIPYFLFTIIQPLQAYKVMNQKATGIFNQ